MQNTDHHASSHYTNMQIQMEMCRVQCLTAVSVFLSSRLRTSMPASVSWQQKESTSRVCLQRVSNSCTSAFTGTRDVDLTFRPGQRMSFVLWKKKEKDKERATIYIEAFLLARPFARTHYINARKYTLKKCRLNGG